MSRCRTLALVAALSLAACAILSTAALSTSAAAGCEWNAARLVLTCEEPVPSYAKLGMTEVQMGELWGCPDHVNRNVTNNGTVDQWVWVRCQRTCHVGDYLYFRDGVLTGVQERK
jgi:hypothetical protein